MKERGRRSLRAQTGEHLSRRRRRSAHETNEAFVDAFVDALRAILHNERPRAA
jgi:hypothetical protein